MNETIKSELPSVETKPDDQNAQGKAGPGLLATGSIIGAVLTSACCVVPLALFGLGISGAWIANLTALAPYQPIFLTLTAAFLVGSYVMVYRRSKTQYADGSYCESTTADRVIKTALWVATLLVLAALFVTYILPAITNN